MTFPSSLLIPPVSGLWRLPPLPSQSLTIQVEGDHGLPRYRPLFASEQSLQAAIRLFDGLPTYSFVTRFPSFDSIFGRLYG
jgi:hypothetical protein